MKRMIKIVFPVVFVFFACGLCSAIGFADLQDLIAITPADLANQVVGAGNVAPPPTTPPAFVGSEFGAGTFTNGLVDGLGINNGLILSTGDIQNAVGPNLDPTLGLDNVQAGHPALDLLISPQTTADAAALNFFFVPPPNISSVNFKYVFASDEYPESIGTGFNDVFSLFVDGQNVALVPGTASPVSVNTLNAAATPFFFNDNSAGIFGTQFDGFSTVITATVPVTPGVARQISLLIGDGTDRVGDSAVFVAPATAVFDDLPLAHFAFQHVLSIFNAGITAGCSAAPPNFCPDLPITRGQMAVFIETSLGRPANVCTGGVFGDVNAASVGSTFCGFIEKLAADAITGGCAPGAFCPNDPISRGQMAVFIEAALGNPANACTGQFTDVPAGNAFCGFIERLAADGITGGCGPGVYCPDAPVTRGQMAVFLVAAPSPLTP